MPASETLAWLILRLAYAWMFLYPLKALLSDMPGTQNMVKLLFPRFSTLFTWAMLAVMFLGSLMILFGIYAQIAGLALLIYNLLGIIIHCKLAGLITATPLSESASETDKAIFQTAANIGIGGHISSSQKNVVLAAVACFFLLMGSGPMSMTPNLF